MPHRFESLVTLGGRVNYMLHLLHSICNISINQWPIIAYHSLIH